MSQKFQYIIDFLANTDKFQREVGGIKSTLKSVGVAAAAYFTTDAVISFARASAQAYNDSIQSETALLTALKGRKDVQEGLIDQASDLMSKTLFDDDEIVRAQSLVAAFVKEEDKIKTLIPLIQDFATAKQMDLAGAADLVTKTLSGEMNALGRYGIKVEGVAGSSERLAMITKGLNDAFGGQAEAAAKVGTAAIIQLTNEYGNLKEEIGKLIIAQQNEAGSFTKMLTEMTRGATQYFSDIQTMKDADSLSNADGLKAWWAWISPFGSEEYWQKASAEIKARKSMLDGLKQEESNDNYPVLTDSIKNYANSFEGLNEKLKDYNDELKKIAPNDQAAITAKLQQIIATENQIKKVDELKTKLEAMQRVSQDPMRGQKMVQIMPTWVNNGGFNLDAPLNLDGEPTGLATSKDWLTPFKNQQEEARNELELTKQKQEAVRDAFASGFASIGQSVVDGLGLAKDGFEGFVGGLAETAIKLIAMMLSQSLANAIFGATASGAATGPAAIFTTPAFIATAIAGVMGAFAAIPAFADGGIVYGPTMGLMGEYPGARSNPEVIAPLSKLQAMISRSGNDRPIILQPSVDFTGDKMRVMLNTVENKRLKRVGK